MTCTCDFGAAPSDVTLVKCSESLGQVGAILLQRLQYDNSGTPTDNMLTVANGAIAESVFTTAFAKSTAEKLLVTPITYNPSFTPGDAATWDDGKGNTINVRRNGTSVSIEFRGVSQSTIKDLKALECEAQSGLLGVYFVGDDGGVRGIASYTTSGNVTTLTGLKPIPIVSMFSGDNAPQSDGSPDMNSYSLSLPADWSDDTVVVKGVKPVKLIQDKIAAQSAS